MLRSMLDVVYLAAAITIAAPLATPMVPVASFGPAAYAVEPDEILSDPALEERAREVSQGLRCLVCRNENIDESNADLARDLRLAVRERLVAGDTNDEVIDYLVSRYGEFVLLQPRFSYGTVALWATPIVVLLAGAGYAAYSVRRRRRDQPSAPELTDAERRELAKVMKKG